MKKKDTAEYIKRYTKRFEEYGYDPRTLGWGKGGRQDVRFRALSEIGIGENDSVLDVGCGFGDLALYLRNTGWKGVYTGIDIVPVLIEEGLRRYPDLDLRVADIQRETLDATYDWVVGSGLFNAEISDNLSHIEDMLKRLFDLSVKGIACDFMSSRVDYRHPGSFHLEPERALSLAASLSRRVVLRHDYMPFEFCLYVYKADEIDPSSSLFTNLASSAS